MPDPNTGEMTPDEIADYIRRMNGTAPDPLAQPAMPAAAPGSMLGPAGPPVAGSPMAMNQMLDFAKAAAPTINGSYTRNVMAKLGRSTGPATPQTMQEYNTMYDPNVFDLKSDAERRGAFAAGLTEQQKAAESTAGIHKTEAEALHQKSEAENPRDASDVATTTALGHLGSNPNLDPEVANSIARTLLKKGGGEMPAEKAPVEAPAEESFFQRLKRWMGPNPDAGGQNDAGPASGGPAAAPPAPTGPAPTSSRVVVDPGNPNLGYFMGKRYRRAPQGGWIKAE